jgi:hypothetical protein
MKPMSMFRVVGVASALLAIPAVAGAQSTPEFLPVISFAEETPVMGAGADNEANVIVAAPLPPARPAFAVRPKPVRSAVASRSAARRQATVRPASQRPVEPVRVAMARTFWLTVGNGF